MTTMPDPYRGFRLPAEIIAHAVWLYHCFNLSLPGVEHCQSRYLSKRAEVSHQRTRRREQQIQRFQSACHAQRFLSSHGQIHNLFQPRPHRLTAPDHRTARNRAFQAWRDVAGITRAA